LSEAEHAEYTATLAASPEARQYSDDLSELFDQLASTPAVEPPSDLEHQILKGINLPRPRAWFTRSAGWMQGKPVSYAVAAAAGLLVAVGFYELTPGTTSRMDLSSLVGTLSRGNDLQGVVQLSMLNINLPEVQGKVLLSGDNGLKLLRFDVNSPQSVDIEVSLQGSGLAFGGFAREADAGADDFSFSNGDIRLSNIGPQRFSVILRDVATTGATPGSIEVSVTQQGNALFQGVLSP
jgi:hypothetical protein